MKRHIYGLVLTLVSMFYLSGVFAQERVSVFVSDLHFGLGRISDDKWYPYEDFRWTQALKGFLAKVSKDGNDNVDLVILGDFFELWQLPEDIKCQGIGAGAGCSVPELVDLATRITNAHAVDLQSLKEFSLRGTNRIHVVPGNHDAALLIPDVWAPVASALGASSGRIVFVEKGVWISEDHHVLAEHGQQIGSDVNGFSDWPAVTTRRADGTQLMIRPWGELFVQKLFNAEEFSYPIIDNLNPESAGVRYRMGERGIFASAYDVAKFLVFNIFETSWMQKGDVLGPSSGEEAVFDPEVAKRRGYKLISDSLPKGDAIKVLLDNPDPAGNELRAELDKQVASMGNGDLQMLCANALLYIEHYPCSSSLSAAVMSALIPKNEVFKNHINARKKAFGSFDVFVYGHTHRWETKWNVDLGNNRTVTVVNTGAFQRLVDDQAFQEMAKDITPVVALRDWQPDNLKPCYSAVFILPGQPPKLQLWEMPETGGGRFRAPGVPDCR